MVIHSSANIDVPVTAKAVHKATLMKEDFVKLSFVDIVDYKLKAGDYVEFGGLKYYLSDDYIPTMRDEASFSYELQFNAPWYNLDSYLFLYNTYKGGKITKRESDWYITDTAANIIALIIRNCKDGTRTCPCQFEDIFYCESTEVKTFSFAKSSILSALNTLAKEYELEWWVSVDDGKFYLHFGECDNSIVTDVLGGTTFDEDGSRLKDATKQVKLVSGGNVSNPSVSQKDGLKRYYFVFGSSRNIDQTPDLSEDGTLINSIATKRLALDPIDMKEGSGEEVVVFDDIYPRSDYQITGVTPVLIKSEEIAGYDKEGNPVYKTYNVYNLKIKAFSDYVFSLIAQTKKDKEELLRKKEAGEITEAEYETRLANLDGVECIEDVIAPGKQLSLKFIVKSTGKETVTPKLAGFEFELGAILNTDTATSEQWYEFQIIKQDVNGYVIPNDVLIPQIGDWVCIFNIKGKYIDGNENDNAKKELLVQFNKWYANKKKNVSYTVKPLPDANLDLNIGDAVQLSYLGNKVVSRVYAFEKKLDYSIDATYTISSYSTQGTVNQLKEEVKTLTATIANGTAIKLDTETIANVLRTYGKNMFLSKTNDDISQGVINFAKGLKAGDFVSGSTGAGLYRDADGAWSAEVDNLTVRRKLQVTELDIQRLRHIGGQVLLSPAEATITEVEVKDDANGKQFILRWPARDSESNEITNDFAVDDQVICQTFNATTQHYWWRRVWDTGTVGGKHFISVSYIDTTGKEMDCAQGSGVPQPGDKIAVLGNRTKADRQSAIIIAGAGTGSPFIAAYKGISSYTLPAAKVYISPAGIALNVDGQVKTLDDVLQAYQADIDDIKAQADEQVVLWFGEQVPTLDNEPASAWTTDDLKLAHIKDIYYNKAAKENGGRAYSFEQLDGKFFWVNITDKDVLASLEKAEKAQDTADGKRRVFVAQPVPPYDPGDLWVNATYPTSPTMMVECPDGKRHSGDDPWARNDILCCAGSKDAGESFAIGDWRMAQAVTTAYASEIKQSASDIKLSVTNLSTGLETAGIHIDGANSRISLKADTTKVDKDLVVGKLKTAETGARIEASGTMMEVYGAKGRNISFGVDSGGYAVLSYYDNNGVKLYDLGPNGLNYVNMSEAKMTPISVCTDADNLSAAYVDWYGFTAKRMNNVVYGDSVYTGNNQDFARQMDGKTFTANSVSEDNLASGRVRIKGQGRTITQVRDGVKEMQEWLHDNYDIDPESVDWSLKTDGITLLYPFTIYLVRTYTAGTASTWGEWRINQPK